MTRSLKRTFGCQACRPPGATTGFGSIFSMGGTKRYQSITGRAGARCRRAGCLRDKHSQGKKAIQDPLPFNSMAP